MKARANFAAMHTPGLADCPLHIYRAPDSLSNRTKRSHRSNCDMLDYSSAADPKGRFLRSARWHSLNSRINSASIFGTNSDL